MIARYTNYRDYDRMLTILTPEHGRLDAASRACRRPKSPLHSASQLFAYGEFILNEKNGKLAVAQCDLRDDFLPICESIQKLAFASCVMDLSAAIQTQEPKQSFLLAYYTISYLSYGKADPADLFVCFLLRQILLGGYKPELRKCSACAKPLPIAYYFSIVNGGVYCAECANPIDAEKTDPLIVEAMRRIETLELPQMDSVKLPVDLRRELIKLLPQYILRHFDVSGRSIKYAVEIYGQSV